MIPRAAVSLLLVAAIAGVGLWWSPSQPALPAGESASDVVPPAELDSSGEPMDEGPREALVPARDVLSSSERVEARAEARDFVEFCREAGRDELPELRRLALESPDPLIAGNAVRALGRHGEVAGDSELLALLGDDRPRVRQELVSALGRSESRDAVRELEPLLGSGSALRPLVIQALGRLGGDRADALLEGIRDDPRASDLERSLARAGLRSP